jgi:hypothetical protein
MDGPTFSEIETEIRDAITEYIPGITVTSINVYDASTEEMDKGTYINSDDKREFVVPGIAQKEHTAKIKIDYILTETAFSSSDFVIINI